MAKVSPTGVNHEAALQLLRDLGERHLLFGTMSVSEFLHHRYFEGDYNYVTYALTDMLHHVLAYRQGAFDLEEYNDIRSRRGDPCVLISIEIVEALSDAWHRYLEADEGVTLGEVFGVEGKGQGKRPKRETIKKMVRDYRIALIVEDLRFIHEHQGTPVSFEKAFELTAELLARRGDVLSTDTIKTAYRQNRGFLLCQRKSHGLGA